MPATSRHNSIWIGIFSAVLGMGACSYSYEATVNAGTQHHGRLVGLALLAGPFILGGLIAALAYSVMARLDARPRPTEPDVAGVHRQDEMTGIEPHTPVGEVTPRSSLGENSDSAPLRVAFVIIVLSAGMGGVVGALIWLAGGIADYALTNILICVFLGSVLGTWIAIPAAIVMKLMKRKP